MPTNKKITLTLLMAASFVLASAQYTLNSPYSRFAFGDLNTGGYSFNRAMAGTGIALRQANTINILNPASYNAQDSMSFIWDFGILGTYKSYKTNAASSSINNLNFDHVSFSFPVTKQYYISAGLLPYSKMGYNLAQIETLSDSSVLVNSYTGSGNLNQVYFGHSLGLLKNRVNLGVNLQYIFGAIYKTNSVEFSDGALGLSEIKNDLVSGYNANFGLQAILNPQSNAIITIGFVYQTETKLTGEIINNVAYSTSNTTIYSDTLRSKSYSIPAKIGFGIGLKVKDNIIAGIDYTMQDWSKASVPDNQQNLAMNNRLSGGIQYTKNKDSYRSYFERVRYRAGVFYENTHVKIGNTNINDMGFSLGFGFPFKRTNTIFNTAFEFGQRGTTANNLIKENYLRFTFNVSLYDYWFIKRKYQ